MDALNREDNPIQGQCTPVEAWQNSVALSRLPWVDAEGLRCTFRRLVIVAPHPDDEILGCSGLLSTMVGHERELLVIAVTDGEASHPGSSQWSAQALRQERPRESRAALERLGLCSEQVTWCRLGLPDSQVESQSQSLVAVLRATLQPGDAVLTTWRHDGHCDHEAVGQACVQVCTEKALPLIEVPIWAWHWADPEDPRLPWTRAHKVRLTPEVLARKQAAIAAHATQLAPQGTNPAVLTPVTVQRLLQPFEVIFL